MPPPLRLLTGPIRVTGPLRTVNLATLVSADAVVRWHRASGHDVEWRAGIMSGDLGSQRDLERELGREGLDRAAVGREAFVERIRALEADGRARTQARLHDLGATVDLGADALDGAAVVRAARTAFVRFYDAGRLIRSQRVLHVCPRCETVMDPGDSDPVCSPATRWLLRLELLGYPDAESLTVGVVAPELLAGAVAVAVPYGHPAAGAKVRLPVGDSEVPVVPADVDSPAVLVPAHDEMAWNVARQLGLPAVEVLDIDGIVRVPGPLDGLPRFAAREQAAALLAADLAPLVADQVTEVTHRCRRCGTATVPRLGRHWLLAMADFEVAAADMVRSGQMSFFPPSVGEELIALAGASGPWCLSRQVWGGQPVPVASCADCGQRVVGVDVGDSCGKCMGSVVANEDVLDARFVAAMWPLAVAGWPDHERAVAVAAVDTMAMVAPAWVARWALPSIALGLAVAGAVPFTHLTVLDTDGLDDDRDAAIDADVGGPPASGGRADARVSLLRAGRGDVADGRDLVTALAGPATGHADVAALAAVAAAYEHGAPAAACRLLTAALAAGIPADPANRRWVHQLAGPIVGED